nr:hypothetical protein [Tanacetum cinerariifolium]
WCCVGCGGGGWSSSDGGVDGGVAARQWGGAVDGGGVVFGGSGEKGGPRRRCSDVHSRVAVVADSGGATVAASGVEDRIDREMRKLFGFAGKIPPKKFSGSGRRRRVVVAGRLKVAGGWDEY